MTKKNIYEDNLINSILQIKTDTEKSNELLINNFAVCFIEYASNISMVSFKNNRCLDALSDFDSEIRQQIIDDACLKAISKMDVLTSMKEDEIFRYLRTICNNKIKDSMKSSMKHLNAVTPIIDETNDDGSAKYQFESDMNIEKQIENENAVSNIFSIIPDLLSPIETVSLLSEFVCFKPSEVASLLIQNGEKAVLLEMLEDASNQFSYIDLSAYRKTVSGSDSDNSFLGDDVKSVASKVSHSRANAKSKIIKALSA